MRKLRHTLCFRLTDEEWQMYQQLLTHFPSACFEKTRSARFRVLLRSLSKLESYREKRS